MILLYILVTWFATPSSVYAFDMSLYEGSGTEDDPFLVDSRRQLDDMAASVLWGDTLGPYHFALVDDIDLSEVPWWNYVSTDTVPSYPSFNGVLDGRGHVISGLDIPDGSLGGLFPGISGSVYNLTIETLDEANGDSFVLAGRLNSGGVIANCSFVLKGTSYGRQTVVGVLDGEIIGCGVTGGRNAGFAQWLNGALVNSFSTSNILLVDPMQDGTGSIVRSNRLESASEGYSYLNDRMFDSFKRCQPTSVSFLSWNEDGSQGVAFNYLAPFLLYAVPVAFILILISLCIDAALFIDWSALTESDGLYGKVQDGIKRFFKQLKYDMQLKYAMGYLVPMQIAFSILIAEAVAGEHGIIWNLLGTDPGSGYSDFTTPLLAMIRSGEVFGESYAAGGDGSYPPLARAFFWFISCLIPHRHFVDFNSMRGDNVLLTVVAALEATIAILLILLINKLICKKISVPDKACVAISISLLFTSPFIFLVERANILLLVFLLSFFFLVYYKCDSRALRELSLVALAAAASMKLYPAVFGLLLLREKRFTDIGKCVVYGCLLFFIPLILMEGGFSEIAGYFSAITGTVGDTVAEATTKGGRLNFANLIAKVFELAGGDPAMGVSIGRLLLPFVVVPLIFSALVAREDWRSLLASVLLLVLIPGFSVIYMGVFFCIPLALFLSSKKYRAIDIIAFVGMVLVLFPMQILCTSFGLSVDSIRYVMSVGEMIAFAALIASIPRDYRAWKLNSGLSREALSSYSRFTR